eukprot:gnl/MRDRNA2_/MRDRNA2_56699_c0_seq2.p1 gnl/MRDRNA2_/MRDRNA2_56699_c0~~gnl/MRDRNA2_/MRDRNA2_56699_c0_seq2.p1  ORF type:complete len:259 (-),score=38.91 gnl/MRDRNA2_/MRDRNA2_56699_c0_seq2:61-837(-)
MLKLPRFGPSNAPLTRILAYGDSLTVAPILPKRDERISPPASFQPYAWALCEALCTSHPELQIEATVVGLCGFTARTLAESIEKSELTDNIEKMEQSGRIGMGLQKLLESQQFDLVLIMVGTNDLGAGYTPTDIVRNIALLHTACHSRDIQTVALSIPAFGGSVATEEVLQRWQDTNYHLKCWAEGQSHLVAFVQTAELVPYEQGGENWESDGIHFASGGSKALGHGLAAIVRPLFATRSSNKHQWRSYDDGFYEVID